MEKTKCYKDRVFRGAFLAAPVVWLVLYLMDRPLISITWLFEEPLLVLMLFVVRPVLEELVFRGLFQGWLIKYKRFKYEVIGISLANIVVSILFALFHFMSHSLFMAMLVFIPSVVFGYFRDRFHGRLMPSISLHCFYNIGYFLMYQPSF